MWTEWHSRTTGDEVGGRGAMREMGTASFSKTYVRQWRTSKPFPQLPVRYHLNSIFASRNHNLLSPHIFQCKADRIIYEGFQWSLSITHKMQEWTQQRALWLICYAKIAESLLASDEWLSLWGQKSLINKFTKKFLKVGDAVKLVHTNETTISTEIQNLADLN